jgi:hypothetical protein
MKRIHFPVATALLVSLLLLPAAIAQADVGGPYGEYYMAYSGPETLTLMVRPDGGGRSFDEAFLPWGDTADATITLELRNANWDPVSNFPAEDLWLESYDDGLVPCLGGTIADANTDALGMTRWQNPLFGGGNSEALTLVLVNGSQLESTGGVHLSFNSPDINGDLVVNLTDVAQFAADYFGVFAFRSDFHRDGMINLQDLATFAQAYGATCP